MNAKLRAHLDLVRAPNLFTAAADPLAGFIFIGGALSDVRTLIPLMLVSMFLYAGGAALNDVFDVEQDRRERPDRPIPSGRVTCKRATIFGIGVLCVGLMAGAFASKGAFGCSVAIVALILLYDGPMKRWVVAPLLMGGCRALNLMMGMVASDQLWTTASLAPIAIMFAYVTFLTIAARREASANGGAVFRAGFVGVLASILALGTLCVTRVDADPTFIVFMGAMLAIVVVNGAPAWKNPTPGNIQRGIKTFVICIVLFDATIACCAGGLGAGIALTALLIPAIWLSRTLRVT